MSFKAKRQDLIDRALQARRGDGDKILLSYIPGMSWGLTPEDYMTQATDSVSSPATIHCTAAVQNLFAFAGISKKEWVDWCVENKGISPIRRPKGTISSYEPTPLLTCKQMWTVIEEASYGGVPCYTISISERDLKAHDFSKQMLCEPISWGSRDSKHTACGWYGLHDFVWGSGYVDSIKTAVIIPAGIDSWIATEATGYGLDSIYGLVGSYYEARISNPLAAAA